MDSAHQATLSAPSKQSQNSQEQSNGGYNTLSRTSSFTSVVSHDNNYMQQLPRIATSNEHYGAVPNMPNPVVIPHPMIRYPIVSNLGQGPVAFQPLTPYKAYLPPYITQTSQIQESISGNYAPASQIPPKVCLSGIQQSQVQQPQTNTKTRHSPPSPVLPKQVQQLTFPKVECIDKQDVLQYEQYMKQSFGLHLENILQITFRQTQNWLSTEIQSLMSRRVPTNTEAMSTRLLINMQEQLPNILKQSVISLLTKIEGTQQPGVNFGIFFKVMKVILISGTKCQVLMTQDVLRRQLLAMFERSRDSDTDSVSDYQSIVSTTTENNEDLLKQNMKCLYETRRMVLETWEMSVMHMKEHCSDSQKMSKADALVMAAVMAKYIIQPVQFGEL
eukprot:TRINITY_DN3514_c1_g1_i2.p1 TRINITY_DN3514_c1_g1~~TRINITY_DN3514_c1_g1_i2.p1  ORF type:complete len:388 (+),score=24.30 TRINITY_DN3514_c1_g1_i2:143-1306(+)